jgi:hypothetical protein
MSKLMTIVSGLTAHSSPVFSAFIVTSNNPNKPVYFIALDQWLIPTHIACREL